MAKKNINIVDLLDGHIRLYAPIMMQLLNEFPEVTRAYNFIGRDNPSALAQMQHDDRFIGYRVDGFEERSAELMQPMVKETLALQKRCKATNKITEPVQVHIHKRENGLISITAHVSDRLGGLSASRKAYTPSHLPDLIIGRPANLLIWVSNEHNKANPVAGATSLTGAVSMINEEGLLFNGNWSDKMNLTNWVADFPADYTSSPDVELVHDNQILLLKVISTHRPAILFVNENVVDEFTTEIDRGYIEIFTPVTIDEPSVRP